MVGAAAAVVLGLAITAVLLLQSGMHVSSRQAAPKITYRTIITQQGQQTKLRLKDGTLIRLNAASRLRIPRNYGLAKRVVYLHGEAFFKVAHNGKMPFTVKLGPLVIKDLGTAFNISAYDSTNISVAVKEGTVSVRNKTSDKPSDRPFVVQLNKGKVGYFDGSGSFLVSAIRNMALYTGWIEGKLVFSNTPFFEVARQLERRFDVKVNISNEVLKKRTLTATYSQLSLNQILHVLSASLQVSYQRQNDTITFKPKKVN